MHGKIAIYMDSTGRGTVTNSANTFFDFNRQIWNDKKSMPTVGMFVEFRTLSTENKNAGGTSASVNKTITSIRPSKFQEFKEGDFITENDFWKTNDDDELEDLQNSRRSAYITELYRTIDFDSIEKIPLSFTIPQAIQKYFAHEILSVETLQSNLEDEKDIPCILDYVIIKRFLFKAYDTLIFMDNSIDQTQLNALKSIMMHLENSYKQMAADRKPNITKIFNETFLSLQCHYQALMATIDTKKNRLASIEAQMKTLQSEIALKSKAANPDQEKIKARQERLENLQKEAESYKTSLKRLQAIQEDFYKKNYNIFENAFKLSREKLFKKIVTGLNLCATIMDIKIWHLSIKSSGVKNSYFSMTNIENSFCSLSFAEHYLSRLNKSALNPFDQKLLIYIQKITKEQRRKFLVVTSDLDLLCKLKIENFAQNPYYIVKYAPKKVNYQSLMRDNTFDIVYIDEKHVWESVADIILQGKHFDKTGKTKFKLI
ncbi:coiled-coil domain-containing protein [Campylobacter sp. LH-2024]|uniref:coiled-coil domain-containing protein n=1 Tax=Campylobacter sp. LH-2024 TaxID=3239825 RepID=UPI003AA8C6CB